MKYIITESRLNDSIVKYFEKKYPVDKIHYTEGQDDDGNPDDSSYEFYFGDYDDNETIFRWYGKEYWVGDNEQILRRRIELSPIIYFEDSREATKLNKMFGEHWRPVFKKWFYENFGLDIKTIM